MTADTELIIAVVCFCLASAYLIFQILRLLFPVWAWRFDKRCDAAREALASGTVALTKKQIAAAAPSDACFARLVRAADLSQEERAAKKSMQGRMFLAAGVAALLYYVRFNPDMPVQAGGYVSDLLMISLGMIFASLADYRCTRTAQYTVDLSLGRDPKPLPALRRNNQKAGQ